MGIGYNDAFWLVEAIAAYRVGGSCLTLGRQDVRFPLDQMVRLLVRLSELDPERHAPGAVQERLRTSLAELHASGRLISPYSPPNITDHCFFRLLGFDRVTSVDFSSYEGAEFVHDLNQPGLGQCFERPFDLVFDGGTLEHVFDLRNALRNCFEAVAVGGVIMHQTVANNMVNHGFYQFSPTLFHDYYRANRWHDLKFELYDIKLPPQREDRLVPVHLTDEVLGPIGSYTQQLNVAARKGADSTGDVIPVQTRYAGLPH